MAETGLKTYRGNCHCGAFVYEVQLPELKAVGECNCSICFKKGYLWAFPPGPINVVKGDESKLSEYTFNSKTTIHRFCPTCGTGVMARRTDAPAGKDTAINVHALQDVNTKELTRMPFDGNALEPKYQPKEYTGPKPTAVLDGGKLYTGGCHCGAISLALMSLPIDETYQDRIVECNCSICERNAYVWVYPKNAQVVLHGRKDEIGQYRFAGGVNGKTFCKKCGVPLTNAFRPLSNDELATLTEETKAWYEKASLSHPVNLRVMDGLPLGPLKVQQLEGLVSLPPPYVNP